jgi:hypothetical protein
MPKACITLFSGCRWLARYSSMSDFKDMAHHRGTVRLWAATKSVIGHQSSVIGKKSCCKNKKLAESCFFDKVFVRMETTVHAHVHEHVHDHINDLRLRP